MEAITNFKQRLTKSGKNFLALSPVPALKVHLQFTGSLDQQEVVWDTTIQTLASHLAEHPHEKPSKQSFEVRSFMQVGPPQNGISALKIVLAVPLIDEPTIKKTIIMVRCYKRLKVGYHEFGKNL